jgi:serine/threonine protein kinase
MIDQTLNGRYKILSLVGAGSMGVVYRALQLGIEREVAVKVLKKSRSDATSKGRFLREARASSSLASANTVRVFDFGESEDGGLFLVMELLEGESLAQRMRRLGGNLPVHDALDTAMQALKSLDEAHAKGLIHRDLKPSNLFYARVAAGESTQEIVKLLDFGGAKFLARGTTSRNAVDTQEGFIVGTPRYMSPEQARGSDLDARSDLYSLGAVLYHMLTGRPPFTEDDSETVLAHHLKTMPDPPSVARPDADIPPDVDALVMRTLAKDPKDRPQTAGAFVKLLAPLLGVPSGPRASTDASASDQSATPDMSGTSAPANDADEPDPETETVERSARQPARFPRAAWGAFAVIATVVIVFAATRGSGAGADVEHVTPAVAQTPPPPKAPIAARTVPNSAPTASGPKGVPVDALPRAGTAAGDSARSKSLVHGTQGRPTTRGTSDAGAPPAAPAKGSDYTYFE